MSRRAASPLAAVRIGIDDYILPMPDALKLVDLMGKALPAERRYDSGARWLVRQSGPGNEVGLTLVHERELIWHTADAAQPTGRARVLALPAPEAAHDATHHHPPADIEPARNRRRACPHLGGHDQ